nr:DUF2345 domain-containing protein [Paraburkholderia nodosa]
MRYHRQNQIRVVATSGGASIMLGNSNVEIRCSGRFTLKSASHSVEGPAQLETSLRALPQGDLKIGNVDNL